MKRAILIPTVAVGIGLTVAGCGGEDSDVLSKSEFVAQGNRICEQANDEVEAALAEAFELSGRKLSAVHQQLARVYERRGEPARAADELEKYLRANPGLKNAEAVRQAVKALRAAAAKP